VMYYTPFIKSSYLVGMMRRQSVSDFMAAVEFVNKIKKFDQLYYGPERNNDQE